MEITSSRIDAMVATAFNIAAADEPAIRRDHPNGMSPAIAAALPKSVRLGWLESYLRRLERGSLKKHEPLLYGQQDVERAIKALR